MGKLARAKTHESILELVEAYSLEKNEVYFDRDPHMFNSILNFYRKVIICFFMIKINKQFITLNDNNLIIGQDWETSCFGGHVYN